MTLSCPVCSAGFRGRTTCSRCGADLTPLMRLVARSFVARRETRALIADGAHEAAADHIRLAQRLHATPAGRRLELLAAWLQREAGRDR